MDDKSKNKSKNIDAPARLQKILASAGIASRRKCELLIEQGRVTVNGKTAKIGDCASKEDIVTLDGKTVIQEDKVYLMINKPVGFASTVSDPHADKTVLDLVDVDERVFPVGRLDLDSEGLMLLTNDGAVMQALLHPSKNIRKEYEVVLNKKISKEDITSLKRGVDIEGRITVPDSVQILSPDSLKITIHEGRKHIVRRLLLSFGYTVTKLVRVSLGPLRLGSLKTGSFRDLSKEEISELKKLH